MNNKILSTKELVDKILNNVILDVQKLNHFNIFPKLDVVLVGNDFASFSYIKQKRKTCEKCNISFELHHLSEKINETEIISLIEKLNNTKETTGILIQLPLPSHLNTNNIIKSILPQKDVDGFHFINAGKLFFNTDSLLPCTPYGIMQLFKFYNIEIKGKTIVIIGNSNIVGKPLALMCINENATVISCNKFTENLANYTILADILVSATGKVNLINSNMIKNNVIIIDVGCCQFFDDNNKVYKIKGDVDFDDVINKVKYITPVPGGVGPLTVAALMQNIVKACFLQYPDIFSTDFFS